MNSTKKLDALAKVIECKKQYDAAQNKLNFCWLASQNNPSARLRNESIGTLLVELSQGANPETACRKYNQMVDPVNYMRATAPISQNQIKNFEKFVAENGYEESFDRELATVGDVNITEILLVSNSDEKPKGFVAGVTANKATQHKKSKLDGVHEVSYQKFMDEILPKATGLTTGRYSPRGRRSTLKRKSSARMAHATGSKPTSHPSSTAREPFKARLVLRATSQNVSR